MLQQAVADFLERTFGIWAARGGGSSWVPPLPSKLFLSYGGQSQGGLKISGGVLRYTPHVANMSLCACAARRMCGGQRTASGSQLSSPCAPGDLTQVSGLGGHTFAH